MRYRNRKVFLLFFLVINITFLVFFTNFLPFVKDENVIYIIMYAASYVVLVFLALVSLLVLIKDYDSLRLEDVTSTGFPKSFSLHFLSACGESP